jgi:lipoprotein-releasing system ATP-binding protein
MPAVTVRNVTKQYPTRSEPLSVLRGVSLELETGQNVAILGASGSGKSTLLYILGTLEPPSSGTVEVAGENPFALTERELAHFRNRRIGFVFQDHHLLPQCSALENVLIPTLAEGRPQAQHLTRAKELLDRVGLSARLEHRPAELSGGERQRVAIARALILQPTLLLADEPTGNLDRTNAHSVADLLLELSRQEQTTLVVVTHSQDLSERFERRLELDDGQLR